MAMTDLLSNIRTEFDINFNTDSHTNIYIYKYTYRIKEYMVDTNALETWTCLCLYSICNMVCRKILR